MQSTAELPSAEQPGEKCPNTTVNTLRINELITQGEVSSHVSVSVCGLMCFVVNLDLPEMTESTKTQDNALFKCV